MVEHLLNLLWLVVVGALFASTWRAQKHGLLRCSLPVALGCTALLALVLFPAVSMSDDMQRAKMGVEMNTRHLGSVWQMGAPDSVGSMCPVLFLLLMLSLLLATRLKTVGAVVLGLNERPCVRNAVRRPEAKRPPPSSSLRLA